MAETLQYTNLTEQDAQKLEAIGNKAIAVMKQRYGDGTPGAQASERALTFHHSVHPENVARDSVRLAEYLGCSPAEIATVKVAAKAHDVRQLLGAGPNESESANWLLDQTREQGLPPIYGAVGALAILGTKPTFTDKGELIQDALKYDESFLPKSHVQAIGIVASADLGKLYTPEGPYEAHQLYAELQQKAPGEAVSLEEAHKFQVGQLKLVGSYKYPLKEAESLLATHRADVIRHHEVVERRLAEGAFNSFEELLAFDRDFAASL